jgi:hypothetical protein
MTAVTPEAAISAGGGNQKPNESPIETVAAKAHNIASILLIFRHGPEAGRRRRTLRLCGRALAEPLVGA